MLKPKKFEASKLLFRVNPFFTLLAILAVFALVVYSVSEVLRNDLHEHVLQREASSMEPLVQYQIAQAYNEEDDDSFDDEATVTIALLETSDIESALSVQLFNALGEVIFSLPDMELGSEVSGEVLVAMNSFESRTVFYEDARWDMRFLDLVDQQAVNEVPILEIYIPLSTMGGLGVARYVLDGQETMEVLRSIDLDVRYQSLLAFGTGALLISIIVLVALNRLRNAYESLDAYAHRLEVANNDLDAVARTAAIGSMTTHLIHGLKNPLTGLQSYLKASEQEVDDEDRRDAQEAGQRMQALINEVLEVIRGNTEVDSYELSLDEFVSILKKKHEALAVKDGVNVVFEIRGKAMLDSRVANIAMLICSNLIQNAVDATESEGIVSFEVNALGNSVGMKIRDTGCGFDDATRKHLFTPVQSTKRNGAGIGLAISAQLAKHIGASIELLSTSESGSTMSLEMPAYDCTAVSFN